MNEYVFDVRCANCRRKLGVATIPREHVDCGVVYETTCRTTSCRERVIPIRFDQAVTVTAREQGY